MRYIHLILFVITIILLAKCSEECSNCPSDQPTAIDTCYTDAPLSAYDSNYTQWPTFFTQYSVTNLHISSGLGYWTGCYQLNGWNGYVKDGVFIYNPQTDIPLTFLSGWSAEWSNDGSRLLLDNGFNGFRVYNIVKQDFDANVSLTGLTNPRWSIDNQWIYLNGNGGTQRVRQNGDSLELFIPGGASVRQIDNSHFVGFNNDGLIIFDTDTKTSDIISFPNLPSNEFHFYYDITWDLSPDRTKILADIFLRAGFIEGRDRAGLFLIDIEAKNATKVLPQQYWGNPYYPTWASDSTFYASYFCRTKSKSTSVSMIWEYDLAGNTIRQVTYPWMILYLE